MKKLKMGMVGGGIGAFIGEVHRKAARMDGGADIVAAANALLQEQGKPGELTLSADTRPIRAGFVLQQGDVEVNCAVETLAELCRAELAGKVAAVLFD